MAGDYYYDNRNFNNYMGIPNADFVQTYFKVNRFICF